MCLLNAPSQQTAVRGLVILDALCLHAVQVSDLPRQDNACDCGLFVLAYAEYFCYCLPRQIHLLDKTTGTRRERLLLDFTDTSAPATWGERLMYFCETAPQEDPEACEHDKNFLTKSWFSKENAAALRTLLLIELCRYMCDQATQKLSTIREHEKIGAYCARDVERGFHVLVEAGWKARSEHVDTCALFFESASY